MKTSVSIILILGLYILCSAFLVAAEAQAETPTGTTAAQTAEATNTTQVPPPAAEADARLEKVGRILLVFLVLSVVFEVALTPIFNWRFFLMHFEGKGIKTPVTVILAFLVFWGYGLDIIKDLLISLGYSANLTFGGQFLTALLIAGGSDGVLRIFTKLGIRNPTERKKKAEEARKAQEANKDNPPPS